MLFKDMDPVFHGTSNIQDGYIESTPFIRNTCIEDQYS